MTSLPPGVRIVRDADLTDLNTFQVPARAAWQSWKHAHLLVIWLDNGTGATP